MTNLSAINLSDTAISDDDVDSIKQVQLQDTFDSLMLSHQDVVDHITPDVLDFDVGGKTNFFESTMPYCSNYVTECLPSMSYADVQHEPSLYTLPIQARIQGGRLGW